jgi:ABC-type uncharacterized transport system permease subunit
MLPVFVQIVARCAIVVGLAFILSRTVSRMPQNKVYRFIFLLVLGVPVTFVINYVDVSTVGYHDMGWAGAFIIAFLFAICGTFWPTQPHNSNTP